MSWIGLAGRALGAIFAPKQKKAQKRVTRLETRQRVLLAKGKSVRAARVGKRLGVARARAGVQPTKRRYPYRIRKGVKQRWNKKYRGWENVPRRRRAPAAKKEIESLKDDIDEMKQTIMIMGMRS